jgi:16S rRNA (adenine1518-N6/adenine1519-N6)-dimethyltransferase
VGSAVIHLECYEKPPVLVNNEALMFDLIRASFNQRRKTLANGIKNAPGLSFSRENVEIALAQMGKSATVRGEALSLEEFAMLTNLLEKGHE